MIPILLTDCSHEVNRGDGSGGDFEVRISDFLPEIRNKVLPRVVISHVV